MRGESQGSAPPAAGAHGCCCTACACNGLHAGELPVRLVQGYDLARKAALEFLETFKQSVDPGDREVMRCVARTSLTTKLAQVRCPGSSQRSVRRLTLCKHAHGTMGQ
jgi:hypothetical protein